MLQRFVFIRIRSLAYVFGLLYMTVDTRPDGRGPKTDCPFGFFSCPQNDCLPNLLLCDGFPDCADGSDERNCSVFPLLAEHEAHSVLKRQTTGDLLDEDLSSYQPTFQKPFLFNRTVDCTSSLDALAHKQPSVEVHDLCLTAAPEVKHTDETDDVGCSNLYILKRKWAVKDACLNKISDTQQFIDVCEERVKKVVNSSNSLCDFGNCDAMDKNCIFFTGACRDTPSKLILAMDVSQSVSTTDCEIARNFLRNLVKRLEIKESSVQVAGVTFTNRVKYYFDFLASEEELLFEIDNMRCESGQTRISKGLEKALDLFDRSPGGTVPTENVVLLLSDGNTIGNDYGATVDAVNELRGRHDAKILTLGMGSVNDEVLQSVATPIENKINIVDYSLLNSYLGYLIGLLCTGTPVDCVVSPWKNSTGCSETCGIGFLLQNREVRVNPSNGGLKCRLLERTATCEGPPCSSVTPVSCQVSQWSTWSNCTGDCNPTGQTTRTRQILQKPSNGGAACPHLTETDTCLCPANCNVTEWTEWECSVDCGPGQQTRHRSIVTKPSNGGLACPLLNESSDCFPGPCPVDCEVSHWSVWSECNVTCGEGSKSRDRVVTIKASNGGEDCPNLIERKACKQPDCAVDCVVSPWSVWSDCTVTCGVGSKLRDRVVIVKPSNGGRKCSSLVETKACRQRDCPVNCTVSSWSKWTDCSVTCGVGLESRDREILTKPSNGGKQCPALEETRECQQPGCPVNCTVLPWTEWSDCSVTCGVGSESRDRKVLTKPSNGGKECPDLEETRECQQPGCPVNCTVLPWSEWSDCSVTCGVGSESRDRKILTKPSNGGKQCPALEETRECQQPGCPVNCTVLPWSEWSDCSVTCGIGSESRDRKILTKPSNGGKQCPDLEETRECQQPGCPVNCTVLPWSEWSDCSVTCGVGSESRDRKVLTKPSNGGKECPDLEETRECQQPGCPVNCTVLPWSEWSDCSVTCGVGSESRDRKVLTKPSNGGKECPDLEETRECQQPGCPVNCTVLPWSQWSDCSVTCGVGSESRDRKVLTKPSNGGKECPDLEETRECQQPGCPVNCTVLPWSQWSDCSVTCGVGSESRDRKVLTKPSNGGKECPDLEETRECQQPGCPVNCTVLPWSEWSDCSVTCGVGSESRDRKILTKPSNGGKQCPALEETRECQQPGCPVNCTVLPWSEWSDCSVTCGVGSESRDRKVLTKPSNGGKECPDLEETRECQQPGCPVNCTVLPWSQWSDCSVTCGVGSESRDRKVLTKPSNGGKECPDLEETRECQQPGCPVNCTVLPWSEWSDCSVTCGIGSESRDRKILAKPSNGGKQCPDLEEKRECLQPDCPVNCRVSSWSDWPDCNVTCGTGFQIRSRFVVIKPSNGGKACPGLKELRDCNQPDCPIKCQVSSWSSWSRCDVTCGNGTQSRDRNIIVEPSTNGGTCPRLTDARTCANNPCPVDCEVSLFTTVDKCTATCGGGIQAFTRKIITKPQNGGKPCPPLTKQQPCNTHQCIRACDKRMNLLFVVDVSGSISKYDCLYARNFMEAIVDQLTIAQDAVHVAAMSFSDMIEFSFSFKTDKDNIKSSFEHLGCPGGWTAISIALEMAEALFMTSADGPEGVRNVTILISDGRDFNSEAAVAASDSLKKEAGMEVFSVGVGSYDEDVLKDIASDPSERYYMYSKDYSALLKYVQNLYGHMCNRTIDCVLSEWKNVSPCSVTCGDGQLLQEKQVIVEPSNGGKKCPISSRSVPCKKYSCEVTECTKDIIIVLDYSSSIKKNIFEDELVEFAYDLVESVPIGNEDVLVAVVLFNHDAITAIGFKDYDSKDSLLRKIKQLRFHSGFTNIPFALLHAASILQDPTAGHRPSAPDYVIVVTDGESGLLYYLPYAARLVKRLADKVFSVGVVDAGRPSAEASTVLSWIASSPQYLYEVNSRNVGEAAETVILKICPLGGVTVSW